MTVAQNKAALLAMFKPVTKTITLPNGTDTVIMRALTVEQTDAVRDQMKADKEAAKAAGGDATAAMHENFGERLLCMSLVDESGARLLEDSDLAEMKQSANGVVELLIRESLVMNGFQKAPAEKNSETTPTADSATA